MLDTTTTQSTYWNGSQFSYNLYLFITIFPLTGLFGVDHLLLRSPITAALKILSSSFLMFLGSLPANILVFLFPLTLFWYFYDIAHACGEYELIKKYGIGVPYFGPLGIGAGMFTDNKDIKESPKDIQRPWLFIAYALTTFFSMAFPLNKFVIGDYEAGFFYLFLAIIIIGIPIVMAQGIYDIFNLLFDTKTVYETGFARIPGVSYLFKDYYTFTTLGPIKKCSDNCDLSPVNQAFVTATAPLQTAIAGAKVAAIGATLASKAATVGTQVIDAGSKLVETAQPQIVAAAQATKETALAAAQATKETALAAAQATKETALAAREGIKQVLPPSDYPNMHERVGELAGKQGTRVATSGIGAIAGTYDAANATAAAATALAKATESQYLNKIQPIQPMQKGGALTLASMTPSVPVLLLSVGLLAFSGYVFYVYKNTFKKPEKSDDPPREPRAVRESFKSGK